MSLGNFAVQPKYTAKVGQQTILLTFIKKGFAELVCVVLLEQPWFMYCDTAAYLHFRTSVKVWLKQLCGTHRQSFLAQGHLVYTLKMLGWLLIHLLPMGQGF